MVVIVIALVVTAGAAAVLYVSTAQAPEPAASDDMDLANTGDDTADGTISAITNLKDDDGNIVRQVDEWQDRIDVPYSIVDPDSDQQVSYYSISVWWDVKGSELDWTTFSAQCFLYYAAYRSPAVAKDYNQQLHTEMKNDLTSVNGWLHGEIVFPDVDLGSLFPDSVTVTYWEYEDGRKVPYTVTTNEKSEDPHPFAMSFYAKIIIEVDDIYGNAYTEDFFVYSELGLMWEGSEFDIQWGSSDDSDGEQTAAQVTPVLTNPNDRTIFLSGETTLNWKVTDLNDQGTYVLKRNGVEVKSGSWQHEDVISTLFIPKQIGRYIYELTVTDSVGREETDTVTVYVEEDAPVNDNPKLPVEGLDSNDDLFGDVAQEFDSFEDVSVTKTDPTLPALNIQGLALTLGAMVMFLVGIVIFAVVIYVLMRRR